MEDSTLQLWKIILFNYGEHNYEYKQMNKTDKVSVDINIKEIIYTLCTNKQI